MARDSGRGMEGTDRDSFATPFIRILQQLSPQCTKGKPGYNPAAKPGMILNATTGELIDGEEGIIFLPCAYQRRFIQWGPRGTDRAGFRGEFMPEDIAAALSSGAELFEGSGQLMKSEDDGKLYLGGTNPKKNDLLADTRSHFGLVLTDNGPVQALIALSASQIKKSKQLMSILASIRIGGKTPPTWMNRIRITTVQESNDQGSWHGIRVEPDGFIDDEATYTMGKNFHDLIAEGGARANYAEADDGSLGGASDKF